MYPILFSWHRYGGRTTAVLRHLVFLDYLGHEFLVHMYVFAYTRTNIAATSYKYFTRVRDDDSADGLPFFLADPACYLRFLKMPRNSQVARKFIAASSRL